MPVLGATLGDVIGSDALTYTVILRAIAAVAIGLAAGAMALEALGEARWAFAAFAVGLGASAAVVGTAVGSLDQLQVEVLLVAAAAVVPLVVAGRRGVVGVGVLFAAAAATHWVFAALFLLLLAAVALALVPRIHLRPPVGRGMGDDTVDPPPPRRARGLGRSRRHPRPPSDAPRSPAAGDRRPREPAPPGRV